MIINPNNPDGGIADHEQLVDFVARTAGRVRQVIVDESFLALTSLQTPRSLAPLVGELPHLLVVNSLSKSHGIAGLRLGYAVAAPLRVRRLRSGSLWNLNALAEWLCELLTDTAYQRAYEAARRHYIRETRRLFDALSELPLTVFPSAANFALLRLEQPANEIATRLLVRHGVYVRDCADKWGLTGDRYLRVAARNRPDNDHTLAALAEVLTATRTTPSHVAEPLVAPSARRAVPDFAEAEVRGFHRSRSRPRAPGRMAWVAFLTHPSPARARLVMAESWCIVHRHI